jgi:hypothetical protein
MVDVRFGRAVGPALLAAAAASIVALAAALPASAAVTVSVVDGNPTCGDLATGTTELKIEPVADGPYAGGGLSVTIDVRDTPDGQVFDWTASQAVDMVVAKGGSEAAVYTYSPEVTSDTGLHSPINSSEKWAGLSHVSLCFDADSLTPPSNPPIKLRANLRAIHPREVASRCSPARRRQRAQSSRVRQPAMRRSRSRSGCSRLPPR